MKISFNSDRSYVDECIYIKDNEIEHAILVGETIDIHSQLVTIYTKPHVRLTMLSKILLFIKRFILTFFNIIIMNFPNKWYENAEPYILEPATVNLSETSKNIIEIKVVSSKLDVKTKRIKKRLLYIDNVSNLAEVTYDKEGINLPFLTYIFDMISLLLYACAIVSFVFFCSGKMELPVIRFIYFIILFTICMPIFYKCVRSYKEKHDFEKNI